MNFLNFTPHTICLNNGRVFESQGIARVTASFTDMNENLICRQKFGKVTGLPEQKEGTCIIVSGMVLSACSRSDLVAPATGHQETIRNDKGHIVSVPGFVSSEENEDED